MDQVPTTQPVAFHTEESSFFSKYWKIVIAIPTTLVIVLTLNYFNILPLSAKFPKYLSFLPHQSVIQKTSKTTAVNNFVMNLLSCPLPKEFCSQAKEIPTTSFYMGLAFKLPAKTAILAPFDGSYQMVWQTTKEGSSSATIQVKNSNSKYSAIYLFAQDEVPSINGQKIEMRKEYPIKRGEQMATISDKSVPYRFSAGNSLIFYVFKGTIDAPENRISLKPIDMTRKVDLNSKRIN